MSNFKKNVYKAATDHYTPHTQSPDEFLLELAGAPELIPVKLRDDNFQLPDSDLLNVLHYYIAHRYPDLNGLFDETGLITLGILMDHWIDEIMNDTSHKIYAEKTKRPKVKKNKT